MGFDMNEINLVKFQDRKWNFPNRKLNYFSHFQASDERTYLGLSRTILTYLDLQESFTAFA